MDNFGADARARTAAGVLLLLLSLAILLGPVASSSLAGTLAESGDIEVVTFDDYPANISGTGAAPEITDQYGDRGVVFPDGVTALRFSADSFPPAPELPRSPQVVITTCYSVEFCTNRIAMTFTTDTQRVAVYVGTAAALTEPGQVVMTAFDAQGTPLIQSAVELPVGGLVPAQNELGVEDPAGRIRSAEIGWGNEGANHDHLVLDDLTITRFVARPELTANPSKLSLTLDDQVEHQTITVNNTGNVALTDLAAIFRPDLADAEPVADIELLGLDCLTSLKPGQACVVKIAAHPLSRGTTTGVIEFATPSGLESNGPANALLGVAVVVSVSPTTTPTGTTSPTTTPTATTTVTSGPSANQTTPSSDPNYHPASWIQPLAGGLMAFLLAALIFVGIPVLSRRLRPRGPRADKAWAQSHPASPSITIRSDPGRSAIDDQSRPLLTLVAVGPRPVTTITEEEP
jgi:hypothetical protein